MLEPRELQRRIVAARELRGISQMKLDALFDADGLGKSAGRIERGKMTMRAAHREAFLRHLRIPPAWLLSESVDELVGIDASPDTALQRIGAQLTEIDERIRRAQVQQAARDAEALVRIGEVLRTIQDLRPGQQP